MSGPLIIKCPKCGHTNSASAMNCDHCHINIAWAVANTAMFEVKSKPEPPEGRARRNLPIQEKLHLTRLQNIGFILFVIVLILAIALDQNTAWPGLLMGLLLFGVWIWFTEKYEQGQQSEIDKIWLELAQQTKLTYLPGKSSFLQYTPPSVYGEYRGRYVSLSLVIEGSGDEYDAPRGFTRITLPIRNCARFSLEINQKWIPVKRYGKYDVISGNDEFDRRFRVRGTPQEFTRKAIKLTNLQSTLLSDKSQSKIMKNPYAFSWASYYRPSIKLDGSGLVCLVHGVPALVYAQISMLNMLCQLAELAEEMGSKSASSDIRRN